ncbi:MAG: chorismate-binding protein [Chlorobi bacterium]|nr:chorismate-binding protein [Chlorobiota bacterium]
MKDFPAHGAWAAFRLPGATEVYLLEAPEEGIVETRDFEASGFYLAPYKYPARPARLIPFDSSRFRKIALEELCSPSFEEIPLPSGRPENPRHIELVEEARKKIRESKGLKKIVLSNRYDIPLTPPSPRDLFCRLACTYPEAFVYYRHEPGGSDWAGASPEPLLSFVPRAEGGFDAETVSLAGTKTGERPWTPKEEEEQAIVTRYIKNLLMKKGYPLSLSGPYTYRQGHLAHLRTDIRFLVPPEDSFPASLLRELHPTPAVGGMPKNRALDLIDRLEGYDRAFYTGFAGFRLGDKGIFHVNLRTMELLPDTIRLYAGGGITAQSDPAAEWEEVRRKWEVMRRIFGPGKCKTIKNP